MGAENISLPLYNNLFDYLKSWHDYKRLKSAMNKTRVDGKGPHEAEISITLDNITADLYCHVFKFTRGTYLLCCWQIIRKMLHFKSEKELAY